MNPYLAEFNLRKDDIRNRDALVRRFAWAIPDDASLTLLASLAPLVEIGCGTGYWASLLREQGVDILAFDVHPVSQEHNRFHADHAAFTEVLKGTANEAGKHPRRTLFLCWPPLGETLALNALLLYEGNQFALVGEPNLTGSAEFYRLLYQNFVRLQTIYIPHWPGINDTLTVWRRKALQIISRVPNDARVVSKATALPLFPCSNWLEGRPEQAEHWLSSTVRLRAILRGDNYHYVLHSYP